MRYRASLAIVFALFTLAPAAAGGNRPTKHRLQAIAHARVNAFRARDGLPPLRLSRSLDRSAQSYARYMLRRGYVGHLSAIRASRRFRSLGELVLMHRGGHGRPRGTVRAWARSPGHRYVMLGSRYRAIGIGKASGRLWGHPVTIWVAHVGSR